MELKFTPTAFSDRDFWKKSGQKQIVNKISSLLADIAEHPETGIGKPEALKYNLSGMWSREINKKNRIVYEIKEDYVLIHSMKGHYEE